MEHYSREEWLDYCRDTMDMNTGEQMEAHLAHCDRCLDIYMSALEESMAEDDSALVSSGFVDKVMKQISAENKGRNSLIPGRNMGRIFANYVVAAGLTLILTFSGFFQYLSHSVPKASHSFAARSANLEETITIEWTEQLINTAQMVVNQINKLNYKE